MIQMITAERLKEFTDDIDYIDKRIKEKEQQIADLQCEEQLLKDKKEHDVNFYLSHYFVINLDALSDLFRASRALNNLKRKEGASQEELSRYRGFNTPERQATIKMIEEALFDQSVIDEYHPTLVNVESYGYNNYSYRFDFEVGDQVVCLTYPLKFEELQEYTACDGKFLAHFRLSNSSYELIAYSYSEEKIRKVVTEWVKTNCHKKEEEKKEKKGK